MGTEKGPTPGTLRGAINEFQKLKVVSCWSSQGSSFSTRYPTFSLYRKILEEAHVRVTPAGQLVFEPAFVLEMITKVQKLTARVKLLEHPEDTELQDTEPEDEEQKEEKGNHDD